MIDIKILASGSSGNAYLLTRGETRILFDCGLPYKKLLQLLDFKLPDAVLVTHEHQDHAKAAKDFINHGVDVFMTKGTAAALELEENHRLILIDDDENFSPDDNFEFWAFKVDHDATEPTNFLITDGEDEILYLTDLGEVPNFIHLDATKILLETNFSENELKNSSLDEKQKKRIFENHLSFEKATDFFKRSDLSAVKEIYLIHISKRHGDAEKFKSVVEKELAMLGHKNIKVFVAE